MKFSPRLEDWRVRAGRLRSNSGDTFGAFHIPGPHGAKLFVVASDGIDPMAEGWEHVSVSIDRRAPNWSEMCFVKNLFWSPDECVIQFHPPQADYVNLHPYCLHLWRYTRAEQPRPPSLLVGPHTISPV